MRHQLLSILLLGIIISGCSKVTNTKMGGTMFKDDLEFLKKYTKVDVLSDQEGQAQVAVCPEMQGRVMTSTAAGAEGLSFGWINRNFIASGKNDKHINPFGGEDRFWMGPEGGQYSIFFKNGDPFDLRHWFTPPAINEEAYKVIKKDQNQIHFRKDMTFTNYSNSNFNVTLDRIVRLLSQEEIYPVLGISQDQNVKLVAYESDNTITNIGQTEWKKESGLLSIWILGMYNPSPQTTIVIPFISGSESELGRTVNDEYFGKVPADRLVIKNNVLFFSGDGTYRSKIGISRQRCKPVLGSYDANNQVLTLVQFNLPKDATDYVNSMWEIQDKPFAGDVVNSYNDGPPEPGKDPMGPFYELETSSPALALKPGEKQSHSHRTIHIQGEESQLDKIAQKFLGVDLNTIKKAL